MIIRTMGNLLDDPADIIIDPCNCIGAYGAGLSRQIHARWPEITRSYQRQCQDRIIRPGRSGFSLTNDDHIICHFPTKDDWRFPSRYEWIEAGLADLKRRTNDLGYSIAMPRLGCGRGGLDWLIVSSLIETVFHHHPTTIRLYA